MHTGLWHTVTGRWHKNLERRKFGRKVSPDGVAQPWSAATELARLSPRRRVPTVSGYVCSFFKPPNSRVSQSNTCDTLEMFHFTVNQFCCKECMWFEAKKSSIETSKANKKKPSNAENPRTFSVLLAHPLFLPHRPNSVPWRWREPEGPIKTNSP